jgi:hypothetical protein
VRWSAACGILLRIVSHRHPGVCRNPHNEESGMSSNTRDGYEAFWPRTPRQVKRKALAPRLSTLEGKTVAQVWDYVFRGDEVFEFLEQGLKARFPGVRFVSWREFGSTHGSDEREVVAALPQRFREMGVDAVISGMGC